MSQAIKLPTAIVNGIPNITRIGAHIMCAEINQYAKEVALVAIILSDSYMQKLYEKQDIGYIACLDILHEWAVEYVTKFAHVEEWEEFLDTDRTYGECLCWDDHVVAFGQTKLNKISSIINLVD